MSNFNIVTVEFDEDLYQKNIEENEFNSEYEKGEDKDAPNES